MNFLLLKSLFISWKRFKVIMQSPKMWSWNLCNFFTKTTLFSFNFSKHLSYSFSELMPVKGRGSTNMKASKSLKNIHNS